MQKLTITISKAEVYEEVAKTTAYLGAKNVDANGKSLFDQVFVTDADKAMLERFWHSAMESLLYVLGDVLRSSTEDDEGTELWLGMTDNFPMTMAEPLKSTAIEYVENKIIGEWCAVADKGEVEQYSNQSGALLMQVVNIIHKRSRPRR